MRRTILVCAAVAFAAVDSIDAAEPAMRPAPVVATQAAAVTAEAARAELRAVFAKAIAECTVMAEQVAQQDKAITALGDSAKWRASALPAVGEAGEGSKRLGRCDALEDLAERVNKGAARQATPELRAYGAAAVELLGDADPARRGMACAFLGLLGAHAVEVGAAPELAAKLGDTAVAVKAVLHAPVGQRAQVEAMQAYKTTDLTVAELAQMALAAVTNWHFEDAVTFNEWWQANGDYESRLWYWALRWTRQGGVEEDLPAMFARDAKSALAIVVLAASSNCIGAEGHRPWLDFRPAGGRRLPHDISSLYFAPPNPAAVAALVAKNKLRGQVVAMAVGDFAWREKVPDYDREDLAVKRAMPLLVAASTKADAPEIRGLLKNGTGLAGSSAKVQVALARIAARLDPENAATVLLEQLERNPALPSLAADLVALTGVKQWDAIKASYTHAPAGDEAGTTALIGALAALKPAEARARLAELLKADALDVTLDDSGNPTDKSHDKQRRFIALVTAAQSLNAGKAVLEAAVVEKACAHLAFKVSQESRPAFMASNRAAIANRQPAVSDLLAFFRTGMEDR